MVFVFSELYANNFSNWVWIILIVPPPVIGRLLCQDSIGLDADLSVKERYYYIQSMGVKSCVRIPAESNQELAKLGT